MATPLLQKPTVAVTFRKDNWLFRVLRVPRRDWPGHLRDHQLQLVPGGNRLTALISSTATCAPTRAVAHNEPPERHHTQVMNEGRSGCGVQFAAGARRGTGEGQQVANGQLHQRPGDGGGCTAVWAYFPDSNRLQQSLRWQSLTICRPSSSTARSLTARPHFTSNLAFSSSRRRNEYKGKNNPRIERMLRPTGLRPEVMQRCNAKQGSLPADATV
jgi:hypothetical protein